MCITSIKYTEIEQTKENRRNTQKKVLQAVDCIQMTAATGFNTWLHRDNL